MKTLAIVFPLVLTCLLGGCATTGGSGSRQDAPQDKPENGDALRSKQRELEYAGIQLEIARMEAESDEIGAAQALHQAEVELDLARRQMASTERAMRLENAELDLNLDRARQRVIESEQELTELEAMYAAEEFADMTKELVLTRGRAQLEMARRSLELSELRAAHQREFEVPRQLEEARRKIERAEQGLEEARRKLGRGELERQLSLLKAGHALEDLRREVEELEPGGAQPAS